MEERWRRRPSPRGRAANTSFVSLTSGEREFLEAILDDNDPQHTLL